jgi:uncharacterized tellurite resistance protein B-like protein
MSYQGKGRGVAEYWSGGAMIDLLKKIFGKASKYDPSDLDGYQVHDVRVATCALLLEMAHIDGEFSESERENIISILKREYGMSDEYVAELIEASHEELEGTIDLWQFTNLINQNYSIEEKTRIIELVWKIAFTDGNLDKHEDYLVHKLANLLRLTHKQLIDAKMKTIHSLKS